MSFSPKKELALIIYIASADSYKVILQTENGILRQYTTKSELKQPRFTNNGNMLVIPSSEGIFTWNEGNILPKQVIFNKNIRTFAVNPVGTEIAYINTLQPTTAVPNDTIYILNLSSSKAHRNLPTIAGQNVSDIDWK
jgi:hypothetical protein